MPIHEVQHLVHELQIHQVELEIQNEELRRAQVELSLARDRYRDLYEFAPVGYLSLDDERHITDVNMTAATLLDEERGNLIGKHFGGWIHPGAEDEFHRILLATENLQAPQSCELQLRRRDGLRVHCQMDTRLSEPVGEGFLVTIADMSARKRAEADAAEARFRYEEIVERATGGIWIVDAEANTTYVNPHMADLLGYTREELLGRNAFGFVMEDDLDRAHREFEERTADGSMGGIVEFRIQRKGGSTGFVLVNTINLLNPDGSMRGMLAMVTDITERKRAQEELVQRMEELRAANEDLSRFNRVAVDRELRMIELKEEINELCAQVGARRRYPLEFDHP